MDDAQFWFKVTDGISRFRKHVGMALILRDRGGPSSVLRNGTISFVDTGKKKLLVTNAHVIAAYEKVKQEHSEAALAVTCESERRPIDISSAAVIDRIMSGVDLAVLEFPHPELIEKGGKCFYQPGLWPPARAATGDVAFVVGFPELHRTLSARGLECRLTGICEFVSSASDRHVMLVDEQLVRRVLKANPDLSDFGSLSGMSGCIAFCQEEGQTTWNLCGFMYEATADGHRATVCINHADFITADGTLDRGRMPWL